MSKVEIVGPKGLLQNVLSILQESGVFQVEPSSIGFIERADERYIRSFMPDERSLSERLFLEDMRTKIDELFSYLPQISVRISYIEPVSIIDIVARTIDKHITACKDMHQKRNALQNELDEFNRYAAFLDTLESLMEGVGQAPDIDFIGLSIKNRDLVEHLKQSLTLLAGEGFELLTATAADGTTIGLIIVQKNLSERIKNLLSDEHIPELSFPPALNGLTFSEKIKYLRGSILRLSSEVEALESEIERFSRRWKPVYQRVKEWINYRLSIVKAAASVFETRMCFFIYGWLPSEELGEIREKLAGAFGGQVVLEEKEICEEDLERVPVALKNPSYFKPFELFTRLLPLPRYTSIDPTPLIGIFFPIFFGMILGDAGYGLILILFSSFIKKRFKAGKNIQDAARILFISAVYSVFFGVLYGEFFGELGQVLFGLEPVCIERRTAIVPMLYFTVSLGVFHITLGHFLGLMASIRKKAGREALFRFLNIVVILCVTAIVITLSGVFPALIARPIIIVILVLTPILLFTGGLLAPFELLKNIGNIISYARIMAIGLTSVLLAFVANRFAGMAGNIVIGVIVAGLLHLLNIITGVFAPTIHSLRLHYVEFFSKFMEHGGRRFEPMRKEI